MTCETCGEKKPKNDSPSFTKATVEILNPKELAMFRKVVVPASMGDDTTNPPKVGKYCNVLLYYEANEQAYLYSSDGIPTKLTGDLTLIKKQIKDLQDEDVKIWEEIELIEMSSDVVDIVGTYAELQQYDTSKLHDNDIIKVLRDETHDNETAYYRWSTTTSSFSYVGSEGPYYTESEIDTMLAAKQDTLIAGTNIQIASDGVTISATDTTYSDFVGATTSTDGDNGLVPKPLIADKDKFLQGDGTWGTPTDTTYTAGTNIQISAQNVISADVPSVVQTYGTSDDDVMSQFAATKLVFGGYTTSPQGQNYLTGGISIGRNLSVSSDEDFKDTIYIGRAAGGGSSNQGAISIGGESSTDEGCVSLGFKASSSASGSSIQHVGGIAIGALSSVGDSDVDISDQASIVSVGRDASTTFVDADGNTINVPAFTRRIVRVRDPLHAQDAATKNYVDTIAATIPKINVFYTDTYLEYLSNGTEFAVYKDEARTTLISSADYSNKFGDEIFYIVDYSGTVSVLYWSDYWDELAIDTSVGRIELTSATTANKTFKMVGSGYNYMPFSGASASVVGKNGLVPTPAIGDQDKYLKGDGTWATLPGANNISSNDWSALWQ